MIVAKKCALVAKFTLSALVLGTVALSGSPASAAVVTWAGTQSANWSNGASWLGGVAPVNGDSVLFTSTGTGTISNVNNAGSRTLVGLTFDASLNRSYTLSSSGTVTVQNITNSSSVMQYFNNAVSLSGGTINTGTSGIRFTGPVLGSGAIVKTGSGLLDLASVNPNLAGNYSGTLTVSAGTLQLSSGVPSANVVVNSGATLQSAENNTSGGLAASITVASGAFLSPGSGVVGQTSAFNVSGNVTLGAGSTTTLEVAGLSSDSIVSTSGVFTFGGALKLNVSDVASMSFVDPATGSAPIWNDNDVGSPTSWQLFKNGGSATYLSNFSTVSFTLSGTTYNFQQGSSGLWRTVTNGVLGTISGTTTPNEFIFATQDVTYEGKDFKAGTLYAVPEPSTMVFAGIGAAMFGWQALTSHRRRNRRKTAEAAA